MVVVFHNNLKITGVQCDEFNFNHLAGQPILKGITELIKTIPNYAVAWCHEDYKEYLSYETLTDIHLPNHIIYSFNPNKTDFFNRIIGYVDLTSGIPITYTNTHPTWLLSSTSGMATLQLLKTALYELEDDTDFDYFLKSFAKLAQSKGVFSYSEPKLLEGYVHEINTQNSKELAKIAQFTKQHYKTGWLFILLYALVIHEKNYAFIAFFKALFFKRRKFKGTITIDSLKNYKTIEVLDKEIDVLIPTIGREKYLYDVLCDLKKQTVLPKRIIIIEQNPDLNSISSLGYLFDEVWPFVIVHKFTHQAGVCNARNIGLDLITNEWVFFADDDIRFETDFIERALQKISAINCKAASFNCVKTNEVNPYEVNPVQWGGFGAGSSIVKKEAISGCKFGMGYEFGFGEDNDFGMQIRKKGINIAFFETPSLVHLKAPIGGFRTKPVFAWANETFSPKPSPTVMLFRLKHCSTEQNRTYKLKLFLTYYHSQKVKNPITYFKVITQQWEVSQKWANKLMKKNEF